LSRHWARPAGRRKGKPRPHFSNSRAHADAAEHDVVKARSDGSAAFFHFAPLYSPWPSTNLSFISPLATLPYVPLSLSSVASRCGRVGGATRTPLLGSTKLKRRLLINRASSFVSFSPSHQPAPLLLLAASLSFPSAPPCPPPLLPDGALMQEIEPLHGPSTMSSVSGSHQHNPSNLFEAPCFFPLCKQFIALYILLPLAEAWKATASSADTYFDVPMFRRSPPTNYDVGNNQSIMGTCHQLIQFHDPGNATEF
jgi:hypothetical protein